MTEIRPGIYTVGAIDWDRRLFDELIPLPEGTTYNSYLIRGRDKTALLDTVDPTKTQVLLDNLNILGIEKIDYVIAHHAEQDHSGSLPAVLARYPQAKVVTNPKCKEMLKDLLLIADERFIEVKDRELLTLGDKTLEFIYAPWVHWPETMLTYIKEDKILFTCDFFGSHLAVSELYADNSPQVYNSAKRYYAEIMMPFRTSIANNMEKIKDLQFELIAPSHGPIYDHPSFIIDAYKDWISPDVKNEVVLPFVSMHGSTRAMVDHLVDALMKRDIAVTPFNLSRTDIGQLAMSLVDAATLVAASPTVLAGAHPLMAYAVSLANALRPKLRYASVIGSYGLGGKTVEQIAGMAGNLKMELIEPVMVKGYPLKKDLEALDALADKIAEKHRKEGIL